MADTKEFLTSHWGMILSVIGIAVGTSNIWRFCTSAAQNGGGSFLIRWAIFLFIWSISLMITEFAIGKPERLGTVGGIASLAGNRFAWMGAFVGFVSTAGRLASTADQREGLAVVLIPALKKERQKSDQ